MEASAPMYKMTGADVVKPVVVKRKPTALVAPEYVPLVEMADTALELPFIVPLNVTVGIVRITNGNAHLNSVAVTAIPTAAIDGEEAVKTRQ